MTDLNNLFTKHNRPLPPIKRLFVDDLTPSKSRSTQPHKSIRKLNHHGDKNTSIFQTKNFAKRYIEKQDIKKQINYYNEQILLAYIRKLFFIMGGVLLFNILFTSSLQITILSNMVLALVFVQIQLGKDLLGKVYFIVSKEIVKIIVYCLNFYLFFIEIHPSISIKYEINIEILLISVNAVLNYIILSFFSPLITLERVKNIKQPYLSTHLWIKQQICQFVQSLQTIYHLRRPILLLNFTYWLFLIIYIIYNKSEILLNQLISLQTLFVFVLTTFILYTFLYIIKKANEMIIVQLLSSNKKVINLNLLRLNRQNRNNQMIINEALKYIWRNCEIIWDVEFISHNYAIAYDVLEDYLNIQLLKINDQLAVVNRNLYKYDLYNSKRYEMKHSYFSSLVNYVRQIIQIYQIAKLIQKKQFVFYIIEHALYFETFSEDFPVNIPTICRKIAKCNEIFDQLVQKLRNLQFKQSIDAFHTYIQQNILIPYKS